MSYRYALAGNPNSGKTTLFNALTGSNQYVGNWPGVTVEKKEGKIIHGHIEATIVDLPGIYSLSPYTAEEIVTRNFILDEKPDLILNIVDATNLERNLYLTLQLAELGIPMVIALNMMDVIEKEGDKLDYQKLSLLLGIPVVPISASKGEGVHKLLHATHHEVDHEQRPGHLGKHEDSRRIDDIYTGDCKKAVEFIENMISEKCEEKELPLRWTAVKLIEGDQITKKAIGLDKKALKDIDEIAKSIETENVDREMIIADQKYKYICELREKVLKRAHDVSELTVSDKIDRIITNKYLAIPIFALVMALVFFITFGAPGSALTDLMDMLINQKFADLIRSLMVSAGAADWATGLICDGVIAGVGSILTFFPQIILLFFFLSLLEDSGYMARAAFIMDRALHSIGLTGKSFVPMLMGFGCSVPAIMATRTLENEKDRRLTIMMIPFMSCPAKMPVYMMLITAFFTRSWLAVTSIYALGIIVAIIYSLVLQKTVLRGGHAPFVMELPAYHLPTVKSLGMHLWTRVKDFLSKAGTVLLGASVIVWVLTYFNFSFKHVENSAESMMGIIGTFIAPVFKPLGFGDWKSSVAMLSGIIARESIASTLGILYGATGDGLTLALRNAFTPVQAYSFMVFSLLFIPCIAAMTTIRKEMNSVKWTAMALGFQSIVAWVITFIIYQGGTLISNLVK